MAEHRRQPGRRVAEPPGRRAARSRPRGRRAAAPQPRHGRIAAAGFSLVVTAVALLAGVGIIPIGGPGTPVAAEGDIRPAAQAGAAAGVEADVATNGADAAADRALEAPAEQGSADGTTDVAATGAEKAAGKAADPGRSGEQAALPADSGSGRRVVFSITEQRIWLVEEDGRVLSTYLASGSLTDNLEPGTFAVYSRSRHAIGIDDSGTMEYFVRFTRGENAAIGFHSIPVKDGKLLQTVDQLGTPTSHGCIRQEMGDAKRLWDFAPEGTTVVVTG